MTSLIRNIPREYRHRPEEARTQAEAATSEQARKTLLQIADIWERMARYEEQHSSQPRSHYETDRDAADG